MKEKIALTLAASLALLGAAACGGSDCKSKECPAEEVDAGPVHPGPEENDASLPPDGPQPSEGREYLDRVGALVKKNIVRIGGCGRDESMWAGQITPYLELIEPAITVIDEELASGRIDIKWEKITPCLGELLTAAEVLDVLADSGDVCSLITENNLLPLLTREKIPECSKLIEDFYGYYTEHQDEFENTDEFLDGLYVALPFIAEPKLALGDECALNYECKDGFCAGNTALTCGGICVAYKEKGEHCIMKSQCADGLYCYEGICTAPGAEEGAYCDDDGLPCAEGFWCNYNDDSCIPKRPAGESACLSGPGRDCYSGICASGYNEWNEEKNDYLCGAKKANGEPCDYGDWCVSNYCDEAQPVHEDYDGVCADMVLGFPGDACGIGTSCLGGACDMSQETPVCPTASTLPTAGEACKYDCAGNARCLGYSEHWDSDLEETVVDSMGTCYARLNKGDKCDKSLGEEELCKKGLSCKYDDPDAEPTPDAATGTLIYPDAHCVADYKEKGDICRDPIAEGEYGCNPATSFCDTNPTDAELQPIIAYGIADMAADECEELDGEDYNECLADVTETIQDAVAEMVAYGEIGFCHEKKPNYADCAEMSECQSGYCDFLGGSYLCLDFPDITQINVCQISGFFGIAGLMSR